MDNSRLLKPVGKTLGPVKKGLGPIGEALGPVQEYCVLWGKAVGNVEKPCRQEEKPWSLWEKA